MAPCYDWDKLDELAESGAADSDAHVRGCASCRGRVDRLLEMSRAARKLAGGEAPDLRERLASAVQEAKPARRLPCGKARRWLDPYLDEKLPARRRECLEAHLFTCDPCYGTYRATVEVRRGLGQLGDEAPPEHLRERVHAAVGAADKQVVHRPTWRRRPVWATVTAGVVAMALVVAGAFLVAGHHGAPVAPAVGPTIAQAPVKPTPSAAPPSSAPKSSAPVVAAEPSSQPAVIASAPERAYERPSSSHRARAGVARAQSEAPVVGGGTTPPPASYAMTTSSAPLAAGPAPSAPATIDSTPTPTKPLIASVARTTPEVPQVSVEAAVIHTPEVAPAPVRAAATPSTPARRQEVVATAPAHVRPAPTVTPVATHHQPEATAPKPVMVAEVSEPQMKWLPVHEAETPSVTARPSGQRLDEIARRVNTEIARDRQRSNDGWVVGR